MATLTTVNGKPAVEIEDHKQRVWTYLVEVVRGTDTVRFLLAKLGSPDDPEYAVEHRPGAWRCSCRQWQCRPACRLEGCKHIRCCKDLEALLGLTSTVEARRS